MQTASPGITKFGNKYWEANQNSIDLNITSPFDMGTNQPEMAIATTNNSGYELMFAYFDTDRIWRKYTGGTLYSFKPGKTTSVQPLNESNFSVYPNPVKDLLNITDADGADYTISDVTGRSISKGILSGSKAGVDASSLVPGMYILHISKEGHTEQVKFVKQ